MSRPDLTAEDLVAWCDQARRSFYFRPRYIAAKAWEIVAHPAEARRILKAARVFSKYMLRRTSLADRPANPLHLDGV